MHRLVVFTILACSLAYSDSPQAMAPRTYRAPQQEKLQQAPRRSLPSRSRNLARLEPHILPALNNEQLKRRALHDGLAQTGVHRSLRPAALASARRDGPIWRLAFSRPAPRRCACISRVLR